MLVFLFVLSNVQSKTQPGEMVVIETSEALNHKTALCVHFFTCLQQSYLSTVTGMSELKGCL